MVSGAAEEDIVDGNVGGVEEGRSKFQCPVWLWLVSPAVLTFFTTFFFFFVVVWTPAAVLVREVVTVEAAALLSVVVVAPLVLDVAVATVAPESFFDFALGVAVVALVFLVAVASCADALFVVVVEEEGRSKAQLVLSLLVAAPTAAAAIVVVVCFRTPAPDPTMPPFRWVVTGVLVVVADVASGKAPTTDWMTITLA